MNSLENYRNRKTNEFKLLKGKYIKTKLNIIDEINYNIDKKMKCQAKIKSSFLNSKYNYNNTNRNNNKIVLDGLECEYNYQRYDISIRLHNFLKIFYDLDEIDYDYIFTNSGMSALFATFFALDNLGFSIKSIGNIYVETERLLNDYIKSLNNKGKEVLFLDSVSFVSLIDKLKHTDLNCYDIFIIDTTLFDSNTVKLCVKALRKYDKPIILIRSHTKLDMLGIEFSNLGSICILNISDDFDKVLLKNIKVILSFIGGYAYFKDIPPYFTNVEYRNIVLERINSIKANVNYIYEKLNNESNKFEVIKPDHNLFILIKPKKYIDYKTLENDLRNYANNSKYGNLFCYADSFGLDSFGINGYYENMSAKTEVIRLSPSDFPLDVCDMLISDIIDWLEDYL